MIKCIACCTLYCIFVFSIGCTDCRTLPKKEYEHKDHENETGKLSAKNGITCVMSEEIKLGYNDIIYSSPGNCIGIGCGEDGQIVYIRCKPAKIRRGCYGRFFDLTKPFPECCPSAVC